MLACEADLDKLKFPLLVSAKLDDVRAIVRGGVVFSRSNKPIPNTFVQLELGQNDFEHCDGELIVGEPTSKSCYRDTVSYVMSQDKMNYDLRFYIFDHIQNQAAPYTDRLRHVERSGHTYIHKQHYVTCMDTLLALEEEYLGRGYERLILRDPDAPYKRGRSTTKEGYLMKLKRFVDSEFVVIGFEERMHNGNEATTNELGRTKRSSHQENKTGRGDLGAIVVSDGTRTFNVGIGFDDEERSNIWNSRTDYLGQTAKVKYFPVGMKDLPRHPVFMGWRDVIDT